MSEHKMIQIGDEPFEMAPENTALHQYIGEKALFNHVMIVVGEDEDSFQGKPVWDTDPSYLPLVQWIIAQDYPLHLNQTKVPDYIENAWYEEHSEGMDDELRTMLDGQ